MRHSSIEVVYYSAEILEDHSAAAISCGTMLKRLNITNICVGQIAWVLSKNCPELAGSTNRGSNLTQ
jgi:hypothetical protein